MQGVRRYDADGIEIVALDEFPVVGVGVGDVEGGGGPIHSLRGAAADGHDLPALGQESGDLDGGAEPDTDDAEAQLFSGHRELL